MPVRDAATNLPPTKARSGMFKWMISGHKGHKHKQEKLNNAVSQKNKNNLKQQQQQQQQQHHQQEQELLGSSTPTGEDDLPNNALRITEKPVDCGTFVVHTNGQVVNNNSQQQTPELLSQHQQQQCGDVNQNLEKCDTNLSMNGLCVSVDNNGPPPLPTSRPPPPPSHPPPPVPPHGQPLPQPPQQPLPPVPGHHQEYPSQAPGTCTLPRRGLVREDPGNRFRSPSNPPPASHQPPPYSRHQPPDPFRRSRGPYQPPPPPKMDTRDPRDSRESREQDLRELRSAREPREREARDARLSRNFDDTRDADHREARDPREHWDGRDFRGPHDPRDHQDPKAVRESRNFRELRESWERRNSNVPRDQSHEDNLRSSSLPRPTPETWAAQNNRWSTREPDSGFDSLTSPAMEGGPRSLSSPGVQNGRMVNPADVPYSQSTEDLLNASRTSPVSVSSATTSSSVSSPSPVQYPTIRAAKQPCVNGASHTSALVHRSPHDSPRPPSGSPRGLGPPHHHPSAVGGPPPPPRPASPEGALLSDSVYPQHDTQPRYAEIPDVIEPRGKDDRLSHRLSRDLRDIRDVRDVRDNRDLREAREPKRDARDAKDKEQRNMRNNSEPRNNNRDVRTSREFRDTSLPRDLRDNRDSRTYLEVRDERLAREAEARGGYRELSVDVEDHDVAESRQERVRGRRDSRQYPTERAEGVKEVRFSSDPSDGLRVRDVPSYDRRDRDADGADGLQMSDDRGASFQSRETRGQQDSRRGDGCTSSSSVSWMEWTQQLQAYVAWVNSQLRKRGRPLISDLRRDLQSGVVFADLIEIISAGERVAGISREGESVTPQVMRENLDRVLQFMAAKRIRMTHITSKEVAEGNLKSIMRIILALAAHYKPQSVKTSPPPHPQEVAATTSRPPPQPTTHDVGVGPDVPSTAPEKTPNLSTNRRAMVTGGAGDDPGALMVLRRHPSMTGAPATPRDSSPVYENLPRRVAPNRWAYDSLRASHKFQLSGPHGRHPGPPAMPTKANNLDESSDEAMNASFNNSFNASLNTSLEGEGADVSSPGRTRPAALNFWQDLTSRRDPASSPTEPPPLPPSQPPPDDPDNPFRYHTIHRMSGRRKLPQIPGAAGPGSRVTTPQEGQESPRVPGDSPLDRNEERPGGGGVGDEGSREPEGRSQNSSPATSLVRGPTLDQWSREKNSLDPWEQEDLKGVLRDLNTTRDQLLALQKLLQTTTEVESRGVCTSRDSPIIITPSSSATVSQVSANPAASAAGKDNPPAAKTSHGRDDPTKTSHGKDSHGKDDPTKTSHSRDKTTKTKTSHGREKAPRVAHVREDSNLEKSSRKKSSKDHQAVSNDHRSISKDHHTVVSKDHQAFSTDQQTFSNDHRTVSKDHQTASNDQQPFSNDHRTAPKDHQAVSKESSSSRRSRRGHSHKRHSRQELESASRAGHGPRPTDHLVEASPTAVKQELLHLSLARQALEAEKVELTRLLEQREGIITELRKQMHHRDKTIQAQRAHFEDAIRNVQNGKRVGVAGDSPAGRSAVGSCAREELHLVRDAIVSLRSNFRETDPNQHTLDTLEQAIAILIERGGGGGSGGGGVSGDKTSRGGEKQRPPVNGVLEASTKVIYFTERTVTPFMSTINKRLGEIRLRDFKNMFDRPGLFRFHFKSYDPEYGMVKEEIVNDDDILPGVDGKIIAWVEEDAD